jgi:hypothetical protein
MSVDPITVDSGDAPGRGSISTEISYKESYLIRFGSVVNATAYENALMFMMVGKDDSGTILQDGTDTHHTSRLIYEIEQMLDRIEQKSENFATTNIEYACMRLGRYARRKYVGATLEGELSQSKLTTLFGATWDEYFQEMWYLVGANLQDIFGKWSRLENRRIDDAMAGCFMVMTVLSDDFDLWFASFGDLLNRTVMYDQKGQGTYVPFNRNVPATWYSVLLLNGDLGLDEDLINDPDVTSYTVPMRLNWKGKVDRMLGRTKIYWKFGREFWVHPIWCIQKPDAQASNIRSEFDATYIWRPLAANSGNFKHKDLVNAYKRVVAALRSVWLRNRAMVPQKDLWEDKALRELRITDGNAGLLWHQMSYYVVNGGGRDTVDANAIAAANTLYDISRRLAEDTDDSQNYFYQVIGDDMPIQDHRLFYARMCVNIDGEAIVSKQSIRPYGWFMYGVKKTEHRESLDETAVIDHEGASTSYNINIWRRDGSPATGYGVSTVNELDTQTIGSFFAARSFDPYKKLQH